MKKLQMLGHRRKVLPRIDKPSALFEGSLRKTYDEAVQDDCIKCSGNRESHHDFVSGEREFDLRFCNRCGVMTNHLELECQKCRPNVCPKCNESFVPVRDKMTKEFSKYLWKPNCKCFPKGVQLSMG